MCVLHIIGCMAFNVNRKYRAGPLIPYPYNIQHSEYTENRRNGKILDIFFKRYSKLIRANRKICIKCMIEYENNLIMTI